MLGIVEFLVLFYDLDSTSYVRVLTIYLLLVYFVSAAGCHCFDLGIREKVNTGEFVFSFVKGMACLTVLFFNNQEIFTVCFPNLYGQRSGGQDLSISYLKQSCFSHGEGSFKVPIVYNFQANGS